MASATTSAAASDTSSQPSPRRDLRVSPSAPRSEISTVHASPDATSTATLDNFAYGWVTVVPDPFLSTSSTIRYEFRFPAQPRFVKLLDIHGKGIQRTYP